MMPPMLLVTRFSMALWCILGGVGLALGPGTGHTIGDELAAVAAPTPQDSGATSGATAVSTAQTPSVRLRVVLRDGAVLEVTSATVQGKFLHTRMLDGHLQAYLLEDVDLDQSVLTADTSAAAAPTPTPPPGFFLSTATSRSDVDAVWTLTDADVEHVIDEPETGAAEGEGQGGTRLSAQSTTMLAFSGVTQVASETGLRISGSVKNITDETLSGIVIGAVVLDANGTPIGRSRTSLDQALPAGMSSRFAIDVAADSAAASARITVESPSAPPTVPPPSQPKPAPGRGSDGGDRGDDGGDGAPSPAAQG